MPLIQKREILRFIPAGIWSAVIAFLCLMPSGDLPENQLFNIPHFDKLVHAGLYFILSLLLIKPLSKSGLPAILPIIAYTVILGGGLELLQAFFTVSRSGSWFDLLADIIGAMAGVGILRIIISFHDG